MKAALFAFTGSLPCFSHVVLNVLDMNDRGDEAILILEGERRFFNKQYLTSVAFIV